MFSSFDWFYRAGENFTSTYASIHTTSIHTTSIFSLLATRTDIMPMKLGYWKIRGVSLCYDWVVIVTLVCICCAAFYLPYLTECFPYFLAGPFDQTSPQVQWHRVWEQDVWNWRRSGLQSRGLAEGEVRSWTWSAQCKWNLSFEHVYRACPTLWLVLVVAVSWQRLRWPRLILKYLMLWSACMLFRSCDVLLSHLSKIVDSE